MNSKEQKFTALVGKYKSTIYAVCYMFSDNREELDDLFQEVLLRLWTGYDTFRGEADLRTWIYRVSMNCCLNLRRKVKRGGRHVPLSVEMDPYEDVSDRALQTKRLYDRIHRLGLVDRALILLWLEGLSYEEIGEIVGISVKNVSFQLYCIKEQLRKMKV